MGSEDQKVLSYLDSNGNRPLSLPEYVRTISPEWIGRETPAESRHEKASSS